MALKSNSKSLENATKKHLNGVQVVGGSNPPAPTIVSRASNHPNALELIFRLFIRQSLNSYPTFENSNALESCLVIALNYIRLAMILFTVEEYQ